MPDQPVSQKIEDLRARLRLDPKSRLFYPLAEELRKVNRLDEAEKVLRDGVQHHPTYLSGWVSLGRVLVERDHHREATEVLMKALALDPGNVVCARLLGNSYIALGEKVEAVKKFKLVRALLPADDEVEEQIVRLEAEIAAERAQSSPAPAPPSAQPTAPAQEAIPVEKPALPVPSTVSTAQSFEGPSSVSAGAGSFETADPFGAEAETPDPSSEAKQTPFGSGEEQQFGSDNRESRSEAGASDGEDPFNLSDEPPAGGGFEPSDDPSPAPEPAAAGDEATSTLTMADLYARQGHTSAAREIYEKVLGRDPLNEAVTSKLKDLPGDSEEGPSGTRKQAVARLERWLERVGRREL